MKLGFDSLASKLRNLKLALTTDSFNVLIWWNVYCCMFEDYINSHNVRFLHFSVNMLYVSLCCLS
jgi:hypothetical protein